MGEEGNEKMGTRGRNGEWEGKEERKEEGTMNTVTDKGDEESSDGQVWVVMEMVRRVHRNGKGKIKRGMQNGRDDIGVIGKGDEKGI